MGKTNALDDLAAMMVVDSPSTPKQLNPPQKSTSSSTAKKKQKKTPPSTNAKQPSKSHRAKLVTSNGRSKQNGNCAKNSPQAPINKKRKLSTQVVTNSTVRNGQAKKIMPGKAKFLFPNPMSKKTATPTKLMKFKKINKAEDSSSIDTKGEGKKDKNDLVKNLEVKSMGMNSNENSEKANLVVSPNGSRDLTVKKGNMASFSIEDLVSKNKQDMSKIEDSEQNSNAKQYSIEINELIKNAVLENWEIIDLGRLVRLFCLKWKLKRKKTARLLRRACPELVNVDFLEGLNISLKSSQVLKILIKGSGNRQVFFTKVAACLEAKYFTFRDEDSGDAKLISELIDKSAKIDDIWENIMIIISSLDSIKECAYFLKEVTMDWLIPKKLMLIQKVVLTEVFFDLLGEQCDLQSIFPELKGKLNFALRDEPDDADENGNLVDFWVDDNEVVDKDQSSDDEEIWQPSSNTKIVEQPKTEVGNTSDEGLESDIENFLEDDTGENHLIREFRPKRIKNPFILDEAEEDDDVEEEIVSSSSDDGADSDVGSNSGKGDVGITSAVGNKRNRVNIVHSSSDESYNAQNLFSSLKNNSNLTIDSESDG